MLTMCIYCDTYVFSPFCYYLQTKYPVAIQRLLHYPPLRGEKANEKQPGIGVSKKASPMH